MTNTESHVHFHVVTRETDRAAVTRAVRSVFPGLDLDVRSCRRCMHEHTRGRSSYSTPTSALGPTTLIRHAPGACMRGSVPQLDGVRLVLPTLLPDVHGRIVYVATDAVVLGAPPQL